MKSTVLTAVNLCLAALTALMTGCATNASGAHMGMYSASAPVIAIMYDDLFVGETVGYLNGSGTIDVHSELDPGKRCVGSFHYTAAHAGNAELRCNDGAEAEISFNALTTLSGYGYGRTSRGPVSFTYGLTPEEAARYLTLPAGKKLIRKPTGPALVDM
jgi:hypothetical protein